MLNKLFLLSGSLFFSFYALGVSEGLTKEQIQEAMEKNFASVNECYQMELKKNPNLKGKVSLSFSIGSDGQVIGPQISKTTLKDKNTEDCILAKSKTWTFPKPVGTQPVKVEYPFVLTKIKK